MESNKNVDIPQITVRIDKMLNGDRKTKAFASISIGGAFAVHGIRVIETEKGRFISMPQDSYEKNGERKYPDIFHAINSEARAVMMDAVNKAYEQRLEQRHGPNMDGQQM